MLEVAHKKKESVIKNLIIVDDEKMVREILKRQFEKEGFNVFDTPSGRACLEHCNQENIDLIITDIIMPDMEGIELISQVKKKFPKIKIFAISGGGQIKPEGYLDIADKLGALRTFTKPFKLNEITRAVKEAVSAQGI